MPKSSTINAARSLGAVFDMRARAPHYRTAAVQELRPKTSSSYFSNRYHGNFGLDEYPAHSDLAHWSRPPRYLVLRSLIGFVNVSTHIYRTQDIEEFLSSNLIQDSVFIPRKNFGAAVPLSMKILRAGAFSIRWDPLFIIPLNMSAKACAGILSTPEFRARRIEISLSEEGDTLLIDNWKTLHGRSAVPEDAKSRLIERVYLEEIYE